MFHQWSPQGLEGVLVKGRIVNILGFAAVQSLKTTQLCCLVRKLPYVVHEGTGTAVSHKALLKDRWTAVLDGACLEGHMVKGEDGGIAEAGQVSHAEKSLK